MRFEELYSILSEYPHIKVLDTPSRSHEDILYIDYKVETWKDVDMELKQAYASLLLDMNEVGYHIIFKDTSNTEIPFVTDNKSFIPLDDHPKTKELIRSKNLDMNEFVLNVMDNKDKWEYVYN